MKILIIGSCRNNDNESRIKKDRKLAEKIGKELAKRGHEIITGGAGGLIGFLVNSYKKNNGKKWIIYYAINEKKNKEAIPPENIKADETIQTNFNFALRDAFYIEKCDAVLALSGKLLTFSEIIQAVKNYNKKVLQLNIGKNIKRIKDNLELNSVFISSDIKKGINFLEK
ncbi:hypothetical protein FJZ19_02760 [Candidatus Pacearchaeota archaeon]|nr:hypothetical protein [Candidatus Pacearchaeota archaeon]